MNMIQNIQITVTCVNVTDRCNNYITILSENDPIMAKFDPSYINVMRTGYTVANIK